MKKSVFILVTLLLSPAVHAMDNDKNFDMSKILASLDAVKETQGVTTVVKHSEETVITYTSGGSEDKVPNTTVAVQTENPYPKCYFTPNIKAAFLSCIANESKGMRGAWYRFTLYDVAQAIVKGIKEKGIAVNFVIDSDHFKKTDSKNPNFKGEFCSPLKLVIDNGGSVYSMETARFPNNQGYFETLHEKWTVFENVNGKKLLWSGSWNATGQASLKNSEHVIVLDDADAIAQFEQEFVALKACSKLIKANECVTPRDTETDARGTANFARRMNGIPERY